MFLAYYPDQCSIILAHLLTIRYIKQGTSDLVDIGRGYYIS